MFVGPLIHFRNLVESSYRTVTKADFSSSAVIVQSTLFDKAYLG